MKIDLNDPRITAFALGELRGNDAIEIARAVSTDARVRAAVDEARETSSLLMETLGGNETFLMTADQREAVRSVGSSPVITDLASAKEPFWKNPAVAGMGVAAAVAMVLYVVGGRPGGGSDNGGDGMPDKWDWTQVGIENLTTPAVSLPNRHSIITSPDDSIHPVSAAISDDTTSFRKEVKQRIERMTEKEIESASSLPELTDSSNQRWQDVVEDESLNVPLAAGATSWPWIVKSINDQNKLPPQRAIRIEEMVNHFRYKKPSMISGGGLVADMELCHTPWNPATVLLAVHVGVGIDSSNAKASQITSSAVLSLNNDRVQRVRLIGYAPLKSSSSTTSTAGPIQASRSHGNYVIYELELHHSSNASEKGTVATLSLGTEGNQTKFPTGRVSSWIHASSDLRFASSVAAFGMLLSNSQPSEGVGELDTSRLMSLLDSIEKQDSSAIGGDRRGALKLMRRTARLLGAKATE